MATTETALYDLLVELKARRYMFTTPTPLTHARVVARSTKRLAADLRDILGWSLPFTVDAIERPLLELLRDAQVLEPVAGTLWRSKVRVASCADDLFLHSAYPTTAHDAVFFGPDSYRYADFIRAELGDVRLGARIVDIGTGSGVGAIVAERCAPGAQILATDINPAALALATVNARVADVDVAFALTENLATLDGVDIAMANPPYVIDDAHRAYRDGGAMHGAAVSLNMARMALERLSPGGRLLLYTGSAIIDGHDPFHDALAKLVSGARATMRYRELDPDVFGEELEREAYADVERIAVVGAVVTMP